MSFILQLPISYYYFTSQLYFHPHASTKPLLVTLIWGNQLGRASPSDATGPAWELRAAGLGRFWASQSRLIGPSSEPA